jgi:V/A-type H+-transporting ATPase subunit I
MIYPQAMTKVQLIIPAKDMLEVTKDLASQRIFHLVDGNDLTAPKEGRSKNSWPEKATAYAALERRVLSLLQTLNIPIQTPSGMDRVALIDLEEVAPLVDGIEEEVERASEQISEQMKQLEELQNILDQLEPIADVDADIRSLRSPQYTYSLLGLIPVANIDRLETSLERIPFVLLTLHEDERKAVVWLTASRRHADILERAARSAYLNPLYLPETYQGTPAEIIKKINDDIIRVQQEISEGRSILAKVRDERREQLQILMWKVRTSRILTGAIGRYGQLRYTYVILGWVPSVLIEEFSRQIKSVSEGVVIDTFPSTRNRRDEEVPVALHNPRLLRPFQLLVTTYANPRYDEIDPTFLLAFTFPLIFGIMFGDVGHGAALILLGLLLSSKWIKALRGVASLGGVLTACGVSASIFGFLYGSLFGFEDVLSPLLLRPMTDMLSILGIAIGAGVVMLSIGFIISIVNAATAREWGRFLFGHTGIAGMLLYWSLVGVAVEIVLGRQPVPLFVLGIFILIFALAVTFSELLEHLVDGHRPLIEDGLATYIARGFFELFETLISYLSNSISYVRMGAFAVAHGGLSAVFFILAALVGPSQGIGYWGVLLIGNLFIIGFEAMIVGIQTMRLEYYEFFSKFFTGGGIRFEPLTLQPSAEE